MLKGNTEKNLLSFLLAVLIITGSSSTFVDAQVAHTRIVPSSGSILSIPEIEKWYGTGEDYLLWAEEKGLNYQQEWINHIDDSNHFAKWSFTVVRLAFHFPALGPNPQGWHEHSDFDYQKFENVLDILATRGLRAVADDHSYANFGSQLWIDQWVTVANHFKGDERIAAFELRNEASEWSWEQGPWWDGTYCQSKASEPNWAEKVTHAYAAVTDAIRAIDPNRTVIWSDPWAYYNHNIPLTDIRENVVYSFHRWIDTNDYNTEINDCIWEENNMAMWQSNYGPVWLGEFGTYTSLDWNVQKGCAIHLINGVINNDSLGFSLFFYSRSDWGGLEGHDEIITESEYANIT